MTHKTWKKSVRELAYHKELQNAGDSVSYVSWGGSKENQVTASPSRDWHPQAMAKEVHWQGLLHMSGIGDMQPSAFWGRLKDHGQRTKAMSRRWAM